MKVIVQNSKTSEYLDADDRWTKNLDEAKQFETSAQAIVHCVWYDIAGPYDVLLRFDEPECDISVHTNNPAMDNRRTL